MENGETLAKFHTQDNSAVLESNLSVARARYKEGKYEEALKLYVGLAHTCTDSDVFVEIGSCYYMLKGDKEALEYWNKASKLDPTSSKPYVNIGNLYYRNNAVEKAISFWLSALLVEPENAQSCLNLAIAFEKKEMRFESIKYFERYLKYEENKTSAEYIKIKDRIQICFNTANQYLNMGVKFQTEQNDDKAAQCYFKALSNYPNLSKVNLNLGSIFFSDKNLDLALKYWKAAEHIDPKYDKIYSNLAITYDMKEQFDYAYAYYNLYMNYIINNKEEYYKVQRRTLKLKNYLKSHPELIEKHLKLAQEHMAKSEIHDAIDEYQVYLYLNPDAKKECKEIISKLERHINPEIQIIKSCFDKGNKLIEERKYNEAKHYFFRIMRLSSPRYLEYSKAKAKYSQCEKLEVG